MDLKRFRELDHPDDEAMEEAGRVAALVHDRLAEVLKPGQSTLELDRVAGDIIHDQGAEAPLKDRGNSESAITISINEDLIHTPPEPERIIESGDLVSIDLVVTVEGHYSDTAVSYIAGEPDSNRIRKLVETTKSTLYAGILQATAGNTLKDIGRAIEEKSGDFGNVTSWAGHFIGRKLHLDPRVHNTAEQNEAFQLETGMYLAIEPILTLSSDATALRRSSSETVRTRSREPGAHFEHTIRVGKNRADILTARSNEPESL